MAWKLANLFPKVSQILLFVEYLLVQCKRIYNCRTNFISLRWNDKSWFSSQQYLETTGLRAVTRGANHRDAESLGASKSPNNVASMGAIWWGIRGTWPPTFSGGGDIICDVPPTFSLQVLYLEKFQKQK